MTEDSDHSLARGEKLLLALDERYPSLSSLVRVLWFQPLFRAAFLLLTAATMIGALSIPKIWRTTPSGFRPEVRISGIDFFQARALQRAAQKQSSEGHFEEALQTSFMAAANNLGDPELIRGTLNHLIRGRETTKYMDVSRGYADWLLRLTGTNVADLELVAILFERQHLDQVTVSILKRYHQKLTPKLEASYLKALFNSGDMGGFDLRWQNIEYKQAAADNRELQLYRAAFMSGWSDQKDIDQASGILREARLQPDLAELAHRLQLRVSSERLDARSYHGSLEYLDRNAQATLEEHLGYWDLLVNLGRKQEVARLIQGNQLKPASGEAAVRLAKICFSTGLEEEANGILKSYSTIFPTSEALWVSYANLLIEQKRWDELRGHALEMRRLANPIHNSLAGYGCYLEGRADLGLNRRETAESMFRKVPQFPFENKMLAILVASSLAQLGYPEPANKLLSKLEPELAKDPHYWMLLARNAYDLRDANLLKYSLEKAYELSPEDPETISNYAAILLAFREKPEKAIQLTLRLRMLFPASVSVRINHACALLQNKRTAEARRLLESIDPNALKTTDSSAYYMARFEAGFEERDIPAALQASEHVDRSRLLGPDKVWFDQTLTNLTAMKRI